MVTTRGGRELGGRSLTKKFALIALASCLAVATGFAVQPATAASQVFVVNSTADTTDGSCDIAPGDCTLREAINAANTNAGADTINFAIGTGAQTITPLSNLPQLTDTVTIDATTQPVFSGPPLIELDGSSAGSGGVGLWFAASNITIRGLVINSFVTQQVLIDSASNTIAGNYLGTNAAGTASAPGGSFATLRLRPGADNNTIGGNAGADRNVIGGGGYAVSLQTFGSGGPSNNVIEGNSIGVGSAGAPLGSSGGIFLGGASTTMNRILGNSIDANSSLGIDLLGDGVTPNDLGDSDTGPNNLQNFPVLSAAVTGAGSTTVSGTLNSTASSPFHVEFFSSPACDSSGYGEGRNFVGSTEVTTDASGNASFAQPLTPTLSTGDQVTATATNTGTAGDTSEFSACRPVTLAKPAAPQGVTAAAGDAEAEVRWIASDTNGGSAITSYTIESSPSTAATPLVVSAPATTATIPGLTNGTPYTFTVTAKNADGQSSDPSAATESVTPKAGAPPPETVSQEAPASGSVSTGTTTTAADPTNTTIQTPNAGVVSISEGAMTGVHPLGGQYFGQQIDITAPNATAANPMTFTFVTDCSVLPAGLSTCSAAPLTAAATVPLQTSTAAAASTGTVQVRDYSYTPSRAILGQGGQLTWDFLGPHYHSATDSRRIGRGGAPLFDTGRKPAGATVTRSFTAAGIYPYRSTAPSDPSSMTGSVSVPIELSQSEAGSSDSTSVTWATSRASGFRFDVQRRFKSPGSASYGSWSTWRSNTTRLTSQFVGSAFNGDGTYQFRARLENASSLKTSWWSSLQTLTVAPTAPPPPSRSLLDSVTLFHETESGNAQVPDCTGVDGIVDPLPACTWSEEILPDGDLKVTVYTTINGRWRHG